MAFQSELNELYGISVVDRGGDMLNLVNCQCLYVYRNKFAKRILTYKFAQKT